MPFPNDDDYWTETRDFLTRHMKPLAPVLAPYEFIEYFPGTYPYNVASALPPEHFEFVVLHKGMVAEPGPRFVMKVLHEFSPVFGNDVFVILARDRVKDSAHVDHAHLELLLRLAAAMEEEQAERVPTPACAALITTYNRPNSLNRTLPQVLALGVPVVIVDDGSGPLHALENRRIADDHQVPLIVMPQNRGLCNALNTGLSYWLADTCINWISYFQDDVDVHPDLLATLARVQDAEVRPLLSGYDAVEHSAVAAGVIGGCPVIHKRSMPGQHLHAHRDYWISVLPIPTPYLGAPKPTAGKLGQGSDADWWITAWSPNAITRRGGYAVCVPGLVNTFVLDGEGSTWGNIGDR